MLTDTSQRRRRKGKKENANALPLTKKILLGQLSTPTKKPLNSAVTTTRSDSMALLRVHLAPTLRQSPFKQLVEFPDNAPKGNEPVFTTLCCYCLLASNSTVSEVKQAGQKTSWAKQGTPHSAQEKNAITSSLEARSGFAGRLQSISAESSQVPLGLMGFTSDY